MDLAPIQLRRNEDRRLRGGHVWVYSNEIDTAVTPLGAFTPGQCVRILTSQGRCIGNGYINPNSLICARLMSSPLQHPFAPELIQQRIETALRLRMQCYAEPFYRLIFGEGDGLPGLVVDRYGDLLVVQINTAGMEAARGVILDALREVVRPSSILLRNDSPVRLSEGLVTEVEVVDGTPPETLTIIENDSRFSISVQGGQKTGWYFDHRDNRRRLNRYVEGARVLDCFSYQGAWGIQAAAAGASSVLCVDASESAVERVNSNATLNGVADRVTAEAGDAFKWLKQLAQTRERFDVVVLDPPAFVKRRKDMAAGLEAYQRLNHLALSLVGVGGILVSASCSSHVDPPTFLNTLRQAAVRSNRRLQVLEQGHQGPDHPVHPAIAETDYLKCLIMRVID
jgi:23S rRNA (cytosine1962-C5)-methyltransferase